MKKLHILTLGLIFEFIDQALHVKALGNTLRKKDILDSNSLSLVGQALFFQLSA